ncbi:MAG: hypothetical protein RIG77_24520 [Cyclobacteriaceae bacterium]
MWRRALSTKWLSYHLITLARFLYLFQPIRLNNIHLPVQFAPGGFWGTFLLSLVSCLFIFVPIIAFVLNITNAGVVLPELFIVSAFGLVFSIIYRSVQGEGATYLYFDGHDLFYTTFGFYESHTEVFDRKRINGVVKVKHNSKGTTNYKLCLEVEDGRLIMLRMTFFEKKADQLLVRYCELFTVRHIENPDTNKPDNDIGLTLGQSG